MMAFISDNIEYPRECVEQGIEGRVICRLTIDSKGKVVDAMVVRGVSEALDKEAVRVAKRMPAFTPAKNSNKAVACYFMVPFMFKLK